MKFRGSETAKIPLFTLLEFSKLISRKIQGAEYTHLVCVLQQFSPKVHEILAHVHKAIEKNGGYGLGQWSEVSFAFLFTCKLCLKSKQSIFKKAKWICKSQKLSKIVHCLDFGYFFIFSQIGHYQNLRESRVNVTLLFTMCVNRELLANVNVCMISRINSKSWKH